jgi:predicted kinase
VKIDLHTHTKTGSDVMRKQLARIPLAEHRFEEFDTGLYSAEFYRQTYDTMLAIE